MFKPRLIRSRDAEIHFAVMSYLIQNFGSPPRPKVPSPLRKSPGLESVAWARMDKRPVTDWANHQFGALKTLCNMDDFNINLVPLFGDLDTETCAATERQDALAAGQIPYYQDCVSHVFYDPKHSSEPGDFVATTLLQLADIRAAGFKPKTALKLETALPGLMQGLITLTAAVYNRQGFVLANLPDKVSQYLSSAVGVRAIPQRVVVNNLCFAACLALRIRHQSKEQIIATYGVRMNKSFRKKVHHACHQIESFAEELALLQLFAAQTSQQVPTPHRTQKMG